LLFIAIFGCFVGPCHNRLIDKLAVEKKLFLSNTTKPLLNEFFSSLQELTCENIMGNSYTGFIKF
jgi:hypothetical protein